jgi:hypothetical protein
VLGDELEPWIVLCNVNSTEMSMDRVNGRHQSPIPAVFSPMLIRLERLAAQGDSDTTAGQSKPFTSIHVYLLFEVFLSPLSGLVPAHQASQLWGWY